jgi:hypothetical protein
LSFFKKSEDEHKDSITGELRSKISSARMPDAVRKIAEQELDTISRISPSSAEYTIGITYIDYLLSLPWNKKTEDNLDLARAERILNENHYGLATIKERVLEHLAVKVLMKKPEAAASREARRGHDRRAHAHGPRPARGRHPGEGPRRQTRKGQDRHRSRPQQGRRGRT